MSDQLMLSWRQNTVTGLAWLDTLALTTNSTLEKFESVPILSSTSLLAISTTSLLRKSTSTKCSTSNNKK